MGLGRQTGLQGPLPRYRQFPAKMEVISQLMVMGWGWGGGAGIAGDGLSDLTSGPWSPVFMVAACEPEQGAAGPGRVRPVPQ